MISQSSLKISEAILKTTYTTKTKDTLLNLINNYFSDQKVKPVLYHQLSFDKKKKKKETALIHISYTTKGRVDFKTINLDLGFVFIENFVEDGPEIYLEKANDVDFNPKKDHCQPGDVNLQVKYQQEFQGNNNWKDFLSEIPSITYRLLTPKIKPIGDKINPGEANEEDGKQALINAINSKTESLLKVQNQEGLLHKQQLEMILNTVTTIEKEDVIENGEVLGGIGDVLKLEFEEIENEIKKNIASQSNNDTEKIGGDNVESGFNIDKSQNEKIQLFSKERIGEEFLLLVKKLFSKGVIDFDKAVTLSRKNSKDLFFIKYMMLTK